MNGRCETCDVEQRCGYQYKPCDCADYRKFVEKRPEPMKAKVIPLFPLHTKGALR